MRFVEHRLGGDTVQVGRPARGCDITPCQRTGQTAIAGEGGGRIGKCLGSALRINIETANSEM